LDAEPVVAGESLEMPTGPPMTLNVGELSGVTVPIAEASSVLTAVLWICICIGFPATSVRGDFGAVVAFGRSWSWRFWLCDGMSGNVDDLRHVVRHVDWQVCGRSRYLRQEDGFLTCPAQMR
jgi:hypothetical protein